MMAASLSLRLLIATASSVRKSDSVAELERETAQPVIDAAKRAANAREISSYYTPHRFAVRFELSLRVTF
jgi:hypothetical protein